MAIGGSPPPRTTLEHRARQHHSQRFPGRRSFRSGSLEMNSAFLQEHRAISVLPLKIRAKEAPRPTMKHSPLLDVASGGGVELDCGELVLTVSPCSFS